MTFENSAYAINGAEIGAALARRALYAEARQGGIVQKDDLKVSQLAVPGVGLLISEGVGLVLNDYQDDPNEVYVASNPGAHTITSGQMPASNASAKSYIAAIVIGDPDFSQAGHPWMPAGGVPIGQESTFQYVRPTLIEVSAGATTLNVSYPALVLARIDVPANTTTITNAMIVDLRTLASPRSDQQMFVGQPYTTAAKVSITAGSAHADWGSAQFAPTVKVPSWASRAIVSANINGVRLGDATANVTGAVKAVLGTISGPDASFDLPTGTTGGQRLDLQTAGEYDVSSVAGQVVALKVQGYQDKPASPTVAQRLALQTGSQVIYDVRFFEV